MDSRCVAMPPTDNVQSVGRALLILDVLTRADESVGLAELSSTTGLPRSTTYRLAQTLVHHRLAEQDENTRGYVAGLRIVELAHRVLDRIEIRRQGLPILKQLCKQTNLTVHLGILDEGDVVYIEKCEADRALRMHSAVGKRSPAHCTALGKALLAYLPEDDLRSIIDRKGLSRHTRRTIVSLEGLREELAGVRTLGYALDNGEHEPMIRCVGAPVRDHKGEVAAAISLTGAVDYFTTQSLDDLSELVVESALQISRRLGYAISSTSIASEVS